MSLRRRLLVALVLLAFGSLALTNISAQARVIHAFGASFGAAGSAPANPYPLSTPADVAVDNSDGSSAHDVYVTDPANFRVEKFDSSGNFVSMFGKGVNQTTAGNVCTALSGDTCQAGTSGSSPGAFETRPSSPSTPSGPSAGDVYVGDTGSGAISKFDEAGNLISSWATGGQLTGFSPVNGIAVDLSGNLFVLDGSAHWYDQGGAFHSEISVPRGTAARGLTVDSKSNLYKVDGSSEVTKFSKTGELLAFTLTEGPASGLAIDPSSDDLYVADGGGSFIDRFAPNCGEYCTPIETFGAGLLTAAQGLSVDGSSGTVYVANTGAGRVASFPNVVIPDVTTVRPRTSPPANLPAPRSPVISSRMVAAVAATSKFAVNRATKKSCGNWRQRRSRRICQPPR